MADVKDCIILGNFFESFSFYALKTVLFLFLFSKMDYTKDESTFLFHIFLFLVGTFPLFGICIIKCSRRKLTITTVLSLFYAIGCIVLVLGLVYITEFPTLQIEVPAWIIIFTGLALIAICSGGIRIFLFAAGIEKFKLPEQVKEFRCSLMCISVSIFVGGALSTAIAPVLRDDIHCFDDYGCFPLAFAPLGILMILATVMFLVGATRKVVEPRQDASPQQHSNKKIFLTILLLFLILSFFWALFEQQGSRWTLQATRMDGDLWGYYNIKPDQMQFSYYLLSLILLPILNFIIYPIFYLIRLRTPLIKIFLGGLLAAGAFFFAASLEVDLEKLDPVLPNSTTAQLRVYNGMNYDYNLSQILHSNSTESVKVEPLGYYVAKDLQKCNVSFRALKDIRAKSKKSKKEVVEALELGKALSFFIRQDFIQSFEAHVDKPKLGNPIVRPLINVPQAAGNFTLRDSSNLTNSLAPNSTKAMIVKTGNVSLLLNDSILTTFVARSGCVYVLLGHRHEKQLNKYEFRIYNTVEPNTVHMLWQLPQYICITAGEIMITKNAFEFTFSEASAEMQAALQSTWSFTMAIGNLFAVLVMKYKFWEAQSDEYKLFAYIMLIDMLISMLWAICCKCWKPVNVDPKKVEPVKEEPVKVEPTNEEPVNVDPEKVGPVSVEPVKEKPVKEKPVKEKPVKEKPVKEEPVKEQPVKEEPVKEEPVKEEPVKEEPVKEQPVKMEPVKEETTKVEPVKEETVKVEPVNVEPENEKPLIAPESEDRRKSSLPGYTTPFPRIPESEDRRKSRLPRYKTPIPQIPESQDRRKSILPRYKTQIPEIPKTEDRRKSSLPRYKTPLPRIPESQGRRKSSLARNKTHFSRETKPRSSETEYPRTDYSSRSPRKSFRRSPSLSSSTSSSSSKQTKPLSYPRSRLPPRKSSSPATQYSRKREMSQATSNPRSTRASIPGSSTARSSISSSSAKSRSRPKKSSAPTTHYPRRSRIPSNETFKPRPTRTSNPRSSNRESTNHDDLQNFAIGRSDDLPHLLIHNQKTIQSELIYVPYSPSYKRNKVFNPRSSSR